MGIPIRGEMWQLAYAPESVYGTDPGTATYTNVFGVNETANMPDPTNEFRPFWGLNTTAKRNFYIAYRGRQALNGSLGETLLLDGRFLRFPIGTVATVDQTTYYEHTITEATTLDTVSVHATLVDASGNIELMRRWHGGKVNRMTLTAREESFVTVSADFMFKGFTHNRSGETGYSANVADITNYISFPTTQPYLFSYGALQLWGTEFARIRSFRLSIDNSCEPKYYVTDEATTQLPYEHREGKRNYSLAVDVDIEDATIYDEIVKQGIYSNVFKGFQVIFTLTRGSNDTIVITMPSSTPAAGGSNQGCFLKSAPHNINSGSALNTVSLDILVRQLGVVVKDAIAAYP